jgi:hypothetical protein
VRVYDGRSPRGRDEGPRQFYGTIVSILDHRFFRPMPAGGSWHDSAARAWLRAPSSTSYPRSAEAKRDYDNAHRTANVEHYRELERLRCRSYRARRKARVD